MSCQILVPRVATRGSSNAPTHFVGTREPLPLPALHGEGWATGPCSFNCSSDKVACLGSFVVAKGSILTSRAHIDIKENSECCNERVCCRNQQRRSCEIWPSETIVISVPRIEGAWSFFAKSAKIGFATGRKDLTPMAPTGGTFPERSLAGVSREPVLGRKERCADQAQGEDV